MKRVSMILFVLLVAIAGCSKDGGKTGSGDNSSGNAAQSSPKAVVEALFAEAQKEKPDKAGILKLISKEMQADFTKGKDFTFDDFMSNMGQLKQAKVESVTMHESGDYAKVHFTATIEGQKNDKEEIPTMKAGGLWYIHNDYGKMEEKSGKSSEVLRKSS